MRNAFLAAFASAVLGCTSVKEQMHSRGPEDRVEGCWVDVWRGDGFEGKYRRIYGPFRYADLEFADENWEEQISSLKVGPRAWVKVYEDERLGGEGVWLLPNQSYRDLDSIGLDDRIESMEILDHAPDVSSDRTEDQPTGVEGTT